VNQPQILKSITVRGLFGYIDYDLSFERPGADSNMNLLYGENGSGKTTILRLIHSCLSSANNEGLRTWITTVPVRKFRIETSGGIVTIEREKAKAGPYRFSIESKLGVISSEIALDSSGKADAREGARIAELRNAMDNLDFDVLYVSAERRIRSTLTSLATARDRSARSRRVMEDPAYTQRDSDNTQLNIAEVAWTVLHVFQRQIIAQANVGQNNTNAIYLDLAKRLLSAWAAPPAASTQEFEELIQELDLLRTNSAPLKEFKSITSVPFEEFKAVLMAAPIERRADLVRMFQPFLDSTRARVDALTPLIKAINLLVAEMNVFLKRKTVDFDVSQGFSIISNGTELTFPNLSSGEKHLFLIFCTAFLSRDSRCLFLIDEPELSLNVYWQRNLPRTLQRLVEGASVQYLLATHSLEILTEFSERIWTLED
jgi:energy-coupling factor transporter ATP-binding protein EcfA2